MAKRSITNTAYAKDTDESSGQFVQLAKDLVSKFQRIIEPIVDHLDKVDFETRSYNDAFPTNYHRLRVLVDQAKYVLPVAVDLAQAISQRIEHTSLDPFAKLEMRLVLAELETAIHNVERLLEEGNLTQLLSKR